MAEVKSSQVAHLANNIQNVANDTYRTEGEWMGQGMAVAVAQWLIDNGAWWLPDPKELGWDDWGNRTVEVGDYKDMVAKRREMLEE